MCVSKLLSLSFDSRLSMENPVINHVNVASKKASGRFDYKQALENNSDFTNAYRNIFELLN